MAEPSIAAQAVLASEQSIAMAEPLSIGAMSQLVLWLAVVVGLILLCAWLFKRFSGINTGSVGLIKVLTAISLGSRDRIALIQAGDKQILLGISPGRINTLHVFEEPIFNAGQTTPGTNAPVPEFAKKLQSLLGQMQNSNNTDRQHAAKRGPVADA